MGNRLAVISGVIAATAAAVLFRRRGRANCAVDRLCSVLLAAGVVGAGFGLSIAWRSAAVDHHPLAAAVGREVAVTVTPSESPVWLDRGRVMFPATLDYLASGWGSDRHSGVGEHPVDSQPGGRVVVFARSSDLGAAGDAVMVGRPMGFSARIGTPRRRDLTVATLTLAGPLRLGDAPAAYRAAQAVRSRFADLAGATVVPEQAALVPALVLGDTSEVSSQTSTEFRAAGMTHLTAVSGANVTIVCATVLLSARLVGMRAAVLLALVALAAFVFIVQPTASVLRAAMMGVIGLIGLVSSRRRQAIPALSTAIVVVLLAAPQLAVSVGFALSTLATAALILVAPLWSGRLVARRWPKPVADALAVACAAHLATAPLVAAISGRFGVVAVLANLVVAPVIAPITLLGSAAAVLCLPCPGVAAALIRFTGPEVWWVLRVAHLCAGVPAGSVSVPAGPRGAVLVTGVTVVVVVLWQQRWFRRTVAALALAGLAGGVAAVVAGLI